MATHQYHLNKSGSGMASMTACGRNIHRTPLSCNWAGFKQLVEDGYGAHRCEKCVASRQFAVNARSDAAKAQAVDPFASIEWEPEEEGAWKLADDAIIARHKASK